jgi:hypothetical protein
MKTNNKTNDASTYVKPVPMMKKEQLPQEDIIKEVGRILAIGYLRMRALQRKNDELGYTNGTEQNL